jgi:hypothetical protein
MLDIEVRITIQEGRGNDLRERKLIDIAEGVEADKWNNEFIVTNLGYAVQQAHERALAAVK